MTLEEVITQGDIHSIARLCLEEAEQRIGYGQGRQFIHVFIAARREYRERHKPPKITDDQANEAYRLELNRYAATKVFYWIEQQEYLMRTHSDGYNETAL